MSGCHIQEIGAKSQSMKQCGKESPSSPGKLAARHLSGTENIKEYTQWLLQKKRDTIEYRMMIVKQKSEIIQINEYW